MHLAAPEAHPNALPASECTQEPPAIMQRDVMMNTLESCQLVSWLPLKQFGSGPDSGGNLLLHERLCSMSRAGAP